MKFPYLQFLILLQALSINLPGLCVWNYLLQLSNAAAYIQRKINSLCDKSDRQLIILGKFCLSSISSKLLHSIWGHQNTLHISTSHDITKYGLTKKSHVMTSKHMTSQGMASKYIIPQVMTLKDFSFLTRNGITSYYMTGHQITSQDMTWRYTTWYGMPLHYMPVPNMTFESISITQCMSLV